MNIAVKLFLFIGALGAVLLSSCSPIDEAEVMSNVTFELGCPIDQPTVKEVYQIKYLDYNTRIETTRGSISSRSYTDHLQRGLYTIFVEGMVLLKDGSTVWVRGAKSDQLFMDSQSKCHIDLEIMP